MPDTADQGPMLPLERVSTGIPGLDLLTDGGLFRGGVYMVLARPGCGKTILANHVCYRHVAQGGRVVYVTLLAESHARMIAAMTSMSFFDASVVGGSVTYLSGYAALEAGKQKGLLDLLRKTVRAQRATILVVDGLVTVGTVADGDLELKKFVHELQVFAELAGCTTLLLTGARSEDQYALRTMVDGLLELHVDAVGPKVTRTIEVTKFRGGATMLGRHVMGITNDGIIVHPRTELRRGRSRTEPDMADDTRAALGVPGLDEMLNGGLGPRTVTMVVGAPGSGTTTLGLSFLCAGAKARANGLYFGFFEPPHVLERKGDALGLQLSKHVKSGRIGLVSSLPPGTSADALAETLFTAVRERRVKRLFVDGLGGFNDAFVYPERAKAFFGAVCNELRSLGVVTILGEQDASLAAVPKMPDSGIAPLVDNIITLRHVEVGDTRRRLLSIAKIRECDIDASQREFTIGKHGIALTPGSSPTASPVTKRGARRKR